MNRGVKNGEHDADRSLLTQLGGDACMATPAVRALRQGFSRNAELIGICRPLPAEVFRDSNCFNKCWSFGLVVAEGFFRVANW